jgi:hypothetical protein
MAWGKYRMTMGWCKKASKATEQEVADMIHKWHGFDFRQHCKVAPPIDCCFDRNEMMKATRCFTWWPMIGTNDWYEPWEYDYPV